MPALLDGGRFHPLEISTFWPETVGLRSTPHNSRPDFVLAARWEGKEHPFIVESKRSSTPKAIEAAIQQARRHAEVAGPPYLPMVVVPYLSEGALDRLAEEGVSGIDLSGNGLIVVPGEWFVRSTGAKNRFSSGAPIKNVYRGTSSLVARVFFARPVFSSVQEVLGEIRHRGGRLTFPTVSKALKGLEEDLVVGRGNDIRLLQPGRMLDLLLDNYRTPGIGRRIRMKVRNRQDVLRRFAENALESGAKVAGDLPSRYVIMPESDDVARVYTSSIEEVTRGVEFEEASRFPDLELVETADQTVYFDASEEGRFLWISPLQTYLMLATGGKREREVASQLRADLLEAGGVNRGKR